MTLETDKEKAILLLVDIQRDFMPGGALPVEEGDHILAPVKRLMESGIFRTMAATQDWHPENHISFASRHRGRKPMEVVELYGHEQVLWPDHCVQGTDNAELHPSLPWGRVHAIIRKGTDPDCDSYSGFRNNWNSERKRPSTGLAGYLRDLAVKDIFLCGLARDVCVKWTAEDAVDAGFRVFFLWDLTRPVNRANDLQLQSELSGQGIEIVHSSQLLIRE
jgi:nicotinamidase/pyrazinamidase